MKKLVLLGMALATFAMAQEGPLFGTVGRATLTNRDGAKAQVAFEVGSAADGTLRGKLEFASITTRASDRIVRLSLVRPARLVVEGHTATFSGPGVLIVRTPTGETRVQGVIDCRVDDNRRPVAPSNTPDRMAIRFASPTSNATYQFEGVAYPGDLRVFDNR
ncbi:MAG: hypothetical protein K1X67_20150 [Fimbriimonadaceae bacterium]|nr:hypothetical protein [Fimbriimonadaceae bacterium]